MKISNFQFSIPGRLGLLRATGALGLFVYALNFSATVCADVFLLPTPNRAIYEPGQEEKFFVPTPGKPWTCLDATQGKSANQTPVEKSFAPGGVG